MILISGAAGKTGQAIIQALAKSGEPVRAWVRSSDQSSRLKKTGVDNVLVGDMRDPAVTSQAVQGIRAIYHIAPNVSPDEAAIGRLLIDAARSANVEYFIFHSVLHPQIEAMPHHWQKLRVEEMLFESGLPFTILQPTVYMQNILMHWDRITKDGIHPMPYSADTRLSLVDLEDAAQAAARVLSEAGHNGATYELVGTSAMSQSDVADVLSRQLDRPVAATVEPIEEWERKARASGLSDYQVLTLTKMFCYYEQYGLEGSSKVLSYLLQRQPTSFEEFVRRIKSEREHDSRVK